MKWTIDSTLNGPIKFGDSLTKIEQTLGKPNARFRRTPEAKEVTYAFDDFGLHIVINEGGLVSQISIFSDNEVYIGAIQLLNRHINTVYHELKRVGVDVARQGVGLWCKSQKMLLVDVDGVVDGVEVYSV